MRAILTGLFVSLATVALAQIAMLPITVLPDRVLIGSEFVPRCVVGPTSLIVAAGQTAVLADGATWGCVEVAGTLTVAINHDTSATLGSLMILPGGTFTIGTVAAPLPAAFHVRIVGADVPIDTTRDPFQWGHGIVNFGTFRAYGAQRTAFVSLATDPQAGDTSLTLAAPVSGWLPVDELIVPDTLRHIIPEMPRREATVRITSVVGSTVILSKPLDFAHLTVNGPDGRLGVHPIVANVTRNIAISSANPNGSRWHVANIGDAARWDLEGVEFNGLGRTTTAPIDDTSADLSHIGLNPKGRYALHFHHACHMNTTCQTVGNVYRGIGNGKWGEVFHGTHDASSTNDIALNFPGSGFITEDGYEVRNTLTGDLAVYNNNPDGRISSDVDFVNNQPGTEGNGFWLHSAAQILDGNQAWDNGFGVDFFSQKPKAGFYPPTPGAMPSVPVTPPGYDRPSLIKFDHMTTVGNTVIGVQTWSLALAPLDHLMSVNDGYFGVAYRQSDFDNQAWIRNATIVQTYQTGNGQPVPLVEIYYGGSCLNLTSGYVEPLVIENSYLGGCATGVYGQPRGTLTLTNVIIQAAVGMNFDNAEIPYGVITTTGLVFRLYGLHPPRFILVGSTVWDGTGPSPIGGTAPTPPPPVWVTQPGLSQQQTSPTPGLLQFCPTGGMCFAVVKQ